MHDAYALLRECLFFTHTATTEIYTLSLHDALPICRDPPLRPDARGCCDSRAERSRDGRSSSPGRRARDTGSHGGRRDRKSTRLNSSHANIVYGVLFEKKKGDLG